MDDVDGYRDGEVIDDDDDEEEKEEEEEEEWEVHVNNKYARRDQFMGVALWCEPFPMTDGEWLMRTECGVAHKHETRRRVEVPWIGLQVGMAHEECRKTTW
jgi:hypothetical protein